MAAADTIENLLHLGVALKDAFVKAQDVAGGNLSWADFMKSDSFKSISSFVEGSIAKLSGPTLDQAIQAVRAKQTQVRKGRALNQLSVDEIKQYSDLVDAEQLLVHKELKQAAQSPTFFKWFVDEALPTLVSIAKVVVPLLL